MLNVMSLFLCVSGEANPYHVLIVLQICVSEKRVSGEKEEARFLSCERVDGTPAPTASHSSVIIR